MQARHYDPVIGRFLSGDPVGFATGGVAYFNRYAYTANDPVNMVDPDGRSPCPGSERNTCIQADTFKEERSGGQDVALSPQTEAAAIAGMGAVAVTSGTTEKLGFVVQDASGNESVSVAGDATTSSTSTVDSASAGIPEGATAVIHGHIDGRSDGLIDDTRGLGDAQPLTQGLPNVTVSEGRSGARELVGGRLQFRMLSGTMTGRERRQLQRNLNRQQKTFLEPK
jgi:uncharacterized protein RhaS with RHS repeats